jgi:sugar/nucleoside kinase (ribokinase family)
VSSHAEALPRRTIPPAGAIGVLVLGDLMVDVVLAPARPLEPATDVPGRVFLRQGGSAATTARWLARLGAASTLVCAVGRDGPGRSLVELLTHQGVRVHAQRVAGVPTGRIGVLVEPGGDRSFVADRGAADALTPEFLRPGWFQGVAAVHLPAYSLLGEPLGRAGRAAARVGHDRNAIVSVDLASSVPLLADGRHAAMATIRDADPALLFCTATEAAAILGAAPLDQLLRLAPAVVVKRGGKGATVMAREGRSRLRFDVATTTLEVTDSTGAGDAFDAGFLLAWVHALRTGATTTAALRRAALAGHRAAARQLVAPRPELDLG